MNLEAMRRRIAEITARLSALRAQGELSAEELAEIDTLSAEHASVSARIATLERADAAIAASGESGGRRTAPNATAMAAAAGIAIAAVTAGVQPAVAARPSDVAVGADRIYTDPLRGFRSAADFARSVRNSIVSPSQADPRLMVVQRESLGNPIPQSTQVGAVTYLNEGNAADSGWAVPPQIRDAIWEVAYGGDDVVNMVAWEPTSSNTVEYEADETMPWTASGVSALWRTEAAAMTASKPVAPQPRVVRVNELYAFITATDELLEDAPRLESILTKRAGRAINWTASEALMTGNGVGKPLGWLNSPAAISVAKESAQAIGSVVLNNLTKAITRAWMFGGRLRWLANQDILPALVPMTLGNYPLYIPVGGGQSPVQQSLNNGSLLGIPLSWNQHCKTLGTYGDLQLVNLDGYYALRRGDVKYATSIHLYFDQAKTAFRWTFRFGGQPFLSGPISPANGSATQSHFVAIADRTS